MTHRKIWLAAAALALCGSVAFAEKNETETSPDKTRGVLVGQLVKKDGPRITVKGENQTLTLIPHWRGGNPSDGGGLDNSMVANLEKIKVGEKVRVKWVFEEHYRVERIKRLQGAEKKKAGADKKKNKE